MAVDSISLLAQNVYSQIQDRPKIQVNEELAVKEAVNFQNMVQKQFNSFASMSPDQILNHIKNAKIASANQANGVKSNNFAANTVSSVKSSLNNQETVVRKSLINEASLLDVLTATTQANNNLKTVVSVRDKFMESFDKVMNMTI